MLVLRRSEKSIHSVLNNGLIFEGKFNQAEQEMSVNKPWMNLNYKGVGFSLNGKNLMSVIFLPVSYIKWFSCEEDHGN